jgi:hypothetical protein
MTDANDYQSFALECLRWAAETDNEEHRQAFLEMAKVWTQLAVHGPKVEAPSVATAPVNGGNQHRA